MEITIKLKTIFLIKKTKDWYLFALISVISMHNFSNLRLLGAEIFGNNLLRNKIGRNWVLCSLKGNHLRENSEFSKFYLQIKSERCIIIQEQYDVQYGRESVGEPWDAAKYVRLPKL